jgi:hypothetical protein
MRPTAEVLAHNLKCIAAQDIEDTFSEYSADTVFFSADGAVRGPDVIRIVFEQVFRAFAKPGASITSKVRLVDGDYVCLLWAAGDPERFLRACKRYVCGSERKYPNASVDCEDQSEALIIGSSTPSCSAHQKSISRGTCREAVG